LEGGRALHTLPPYRPEHHDHLPPGTEPSADLVRAVVAQRAYKSPEEIEQIEIALGVSHAVHTAAMRLTAPGRKEYEIVSELEGLAHGLGAANSFSTIFSRRGEILHNPFHTHTLEDGDIVVHDSGAESPLHYASDITRTIPANGKFDSRQRDIYSIVLESQQASIDALKPGRPFRDLHGISSRVILSGLAELGIVTGDVDEALAADAHTLFFPCGLGHMMGLDVHDMEAIGEDLVGYNQEIVRNPAFGWRSLRLGRALEPDWVVTVEPGIYFNGLLADRWKAEGTCADFIDFTAFDSFRYFGGVRLEDDFLITQDGYRLLGEPIPKSLEEVELACSAG
ncbi:MAG: M24 family metallopeptidase, partial [Verrucomicrobiales bacterium]